MQPQRYHSLNPYLPLKKKTKHHYITRPQLFKSCIATYGAIHRINR